MRIIIIQIYILSELVVERKRFVCASAYVAAIFHLRLPIFVAATPNWSAEW
jgi:hypothetical protein